MQALFNSKKFYFSLALLYALLLYQIDTMGLQLQLLIFVAGCFLLFLGIRYPLFGLLFSFAAMDAFFNLIPRQLFADTFINKIWDLGFFSMLVFGSPLLLHKYKKMDNIPFYLKVFSLFLIVSIISFVLTIIKYPFPLVDTIRSFRHRLGYLLIPFLLQYLLQAKDGEKALESLLNVLYIISFILLILYNIQFIIQKSLFLGYSSTQATSYGVSYLRSIPNFLFICYLFLWFNLASLLLNKKLFPYGKLYIFLCLSATLFTFTRGIYLSVLTIIAIIIFLTLYSKKYNTTNIIISILFVGFLSFFVFSSGYLKPFLDRALTIRQAASLSQQKSTMLYRVELVEDRIKLIAKENPLLGLGFVHNKYGYKFGTYRGNFDKNIGGPGLGCADIAWGNIIYQTGWLGVGCFSLFIITMIYYIFVTLRRKLSILDKTKIDKVFLIEFASVLELLRMIFQTLNSDAFTGGGTHNQAIIFAIACFAYMLQKQKEYEKNENINSNTILQSR